MPCLGLLLVHQMRFLPTGEFTTAEWIRNFTSVGYVLFGFALFYRLVCVIVLDWVVGSLKKQPLPVIIENLFGIATAIVAVLVAANLLFEGAIAYILTLSSIIGVVIGLALRPIILDVFSGVSTNLDAAFQIGDWVEVHESAEKPGYAGFVEQINWRTMLIRTKTGNYLICPNSLISTAMITNYSRPYRFSRFEVTIKLPAYVDIQQARRVLQLAIDATKNASTGPCPEMPIDVYVLDLKEAAVHYLIRYWIDRGIHSHKGSRHRILQSVMQHLNTAGIPLAEDIILNLDREDLVGRGKLMSQADIFSRIELLRGISEDSIRLMAEACQEIVIQAGERIVNQGEEGDDMFVLVEGGVEVIVDIEGREVVVDSMQAGDYFGEMSLLTGSPRTATVQTLTKCRIYKVSRETMQRLIDRDSACLDVLSNNLAERNLNRSTKAQSAKEGFSAKQKKSIAASILAKMQAVFSQ